MEAAFGDSQEMVAFITELNANYYSLWFIRENGSDQYYRHNKGLLFDDLSLIHISMMMAGFLRSFLAYKADRHIRSS